MVPPKTLPRAFWSVKTIALSLSFQRKTVFSSITWWAGWWRTLRAVAAWLWPLWEWWKCWWPVRGSCLWGYSLGCRRRRCLGSINHGERSFRWEWGRFCWLALASISDRLSCRSALRAWPRFLLATSYSSASQTGSWTCSRYSCIERS